MINSGISVVVPVYNSSEILPLLVERLAPVLRSQTTAFELILVNDGSADDSWKVIEALASENGWIHGINFMRNYGQHNALLCGTREAQYSIIVTMDDDLQHPPEEIPKLLTELEAGYDVVYGADDKRQHGAWRNLSSDTIRLALEIAMGTKIAKHVSAFRAFRTELRDAFSNYQSPFVSLDVLLSWATTRFSAVRVRHDPRKSGRSNYTFRTLLRHALDVLTGFSVVPLQFVSLLGFLFTLFGFAVLMYVIGRYFIEGGSVPGFPFLASVIAIFSGSQLFALGIIGEYLARIYKRTMNRPVYTIRSQTSDSKALKPESYELRIPN